MPQIKDKYQPLYYSDKRYFILTGGRGSGKTFVVQDYLVRLLEQVGQGILYTRYTMTAVEGTIIPLFTKHIELISDIRKYHITKKYIYNKETGSFMMFSGIKTTSGDQTGNLKTLPNITTWVIEEGEDYNREDSFEDIDDSIRGTGLQNRVIWIQNPTTRHHFIYKKFFKDSHEIREINGFKYQHCTHEDVEHIHTTYLDNKDNLDPKKVLRWEETKITNPKKYANKYIGAWKDKADGVIFENWTTGKFDDSLPFIYGADYGFTNDPSTLIKVAVDEKKRTIYLQECMYEKHLSTEQLKTLYKSVVGSSVVVCDSAEPRLINDLKMSGINALPCVKKGGSVLSGIQDLLGYKMIVCGHSPNLVTELNNYEWVDRGSKTIPIDNHNHLIDPIRYAKFKLSNSFFVL